ncbi:MAG TPA: FecR family protein [Candidatus Acidoferrum sp.]|nr:FecR family protein [Candidatus Acidoferrum sp.]
MKDEYLWDGSGQPDPEVQALERTLSKYQYQVNKLNVPELAGMQKHSFLENLFAARRTLWIGLAAAAAVVLILSALGIVRWTDWRGENSKTGWAVERVAGTPRVESSVFRFTSNKARLTTGETIVTDSGSRATIEVADVGSVTVEPNTRLRLVSDTKGRNQFALERGAIHAMIWAAPGEFAVDTPSAIAVDLGCAYTLQVDDTGAGLLRTTVGWVGFKLNGHEAFIPAGAACATRRGTGPGTPYFEDASASFRSALALLDFGAGTPGERERELITILSEARVKDGLSLWHLLSRVDVSDRTMVFDRFKTLVPPPPEVTREGILRLDPKMMDEWWNQLGLGDVTLWRTWERRWSRDRS